MSQQVNRMFRRKPDSAETGKPLPDLADDLGIPKPGLRPAMPPAPVKPAPTPLRPTSLGDPARPAELPRVPRVPAESVAAPAPRKAETEVRKLIVGREISLSGEI